MKGKNLTPKENKAICLFLGFTYRVAEGYWQSPTNKMMGEPNFSYMKEILAWYPLVLDRIHLVMDKEYLLDRFWGCIQHKGVMTAGRAPFAEQAINLALLSLINKLEPDRFVEAQSLCRPDRADRPNSFRAGGASAWRIVDSGSTISTGSLTINNSEAATDTPTEPPEAPPEPDTHTLQEMSRVLTRVNERHVLRPIPRPPRRPPRRRATS